MRNRIHSPNLNSCLPLALAAAFLFFIAPAMAQSPLGHLASVPLLKETYVFNQLNNCVHANGTLFQSTGSLSLDPGTGTFKLDTYNARRSAYVGPCKTTWNLFEFGQDHYVWHYDLPSHLRQTRERNCNISCLHCRRGRLCIPDFAIAAVAPCRRRGGCHAQSYSIARFSPGKLWTEKALYNFCSRASCKDGQLPRATVIVGKSGALFGMTFAGGSNGDFGTVFELTP